MDGLLTLTSPRSDNAKATYGYKLSARARPPGSPAQVASPLPRGTPRRSPSPRVSRNQLQQLTPRSHASIESFRSVSVLEEIVRVENMNARSSMGPDEAFELLHRLIPQLSGDSMDGLTRQQLLDGLEASCWRTYGQQAQSPTTRRVAVPYKQLYHGITESIREKEAAIHSLEANCRESTLHTNELPRQIRAREQEIAKTIASFVALSAASLDCAVQRDRTEFGKRILDTSPASSAVLTQKVKERIATLRRRKDLRAWACTELRGVINDHLTRASELKKEITVILSEVKKEELAHKVKTKRMEDAMVGMVMTPNGRKNSMSGVVATRVMVSGGLAAVATAAALPSSSSPSGMLNERLAVAYERRSTLQEELEKRQEQVRKRTEEIFDVRNQVKEQQAKKTDVVAQTEALDVEMLHIQRSCTPRPDWDELQRAVAVTTAADQLGKNVRKNIQSRERRGRCNSAGEAEEDDDEEYTARQLRTILSSTWSTVDKVDALAKELARIRTRYHGGDELESEKLKLNQLQREIQKTVEQLAAMRSLASRGGVSTRGTTTSTSA